MDYAQSLNLPKTEFKMRANLSQKEPEILKFWEKQNVYQELRKIRKGEKKFILHDGPPYPNGDIHLGTAFNKFLKDVIVKYKSMRGFDSPFIPGWDCHGLPVEHCVSEELGEKRKTLSLQEIREKCKKLALYYVNLQKEQFKRLGVFGDWNNAYLTLLPEYEVKIIEVFGQLVEKGYIYCGLRPVHWCYSCETVLAEAEVEYAEHSSPSIYLKFLIKEDKKLGLIGDEILVWTTTPWTLVSNVAIALHPDFEYFVLELKQGKLLLAAELLENVLKKIEVKEYKIIKSFKGKELEGIICQHPFINRNSLVILADYVTKDVGSGCVHIAPGHGHEDYVSSLKYNLPIFSPVTEKGKFTEETGEFVGLHVFEANELIIERLKKNSALLHFEKISHTYPYCWRCKKPLIFRATHQWFFDLEKHNLRKKVMDSVKEIKWIPNWGEEKFLNTVALRPDWCISRQRAWGVPLPLVYCQNCKQPLLNLKIINEIAKIVKNNGVDEWLKKEVKEFIPNEEKCEKCGCSTFERETDIFDVWFESGVSFAGVLETKEELSFPADIYLEAVDQHRGWFQSSIFPSMAIREITPYRTVITHGLILDKEGKKMSKSKGNVIVPDEIVEKYGADILRLWFASIDYTTDTFLSDELLKPVIENYRKIRNTLRYLLSNLYDYEPAKNQVFYNNLMPIEQWMLWQLGELVKKVTLLYDNFEFHKAYYSLLNFCVNELSSFFLDISKDRLYTKAADSKERRSVQTVFYEILVVLTKLLSPILSFTSEEVWQFIPKNSNEKSVHLSLWPKIDLKWESKELELKWKKILELKDEVYKALEQARIKKNIGHSLEAEVIFYSKDENFISFFEENKETLKEVFIISAISLIREDEPNKEILLGEKIKIKISKANGEKCIRCWQYSETVGKEKEHPLICERCVKMIKNMS